MEDKNIKPVCAVKFDNLDTSVQTFKNIIESLNHQNNEITKLHIEIAKMNEQYKFNIESMAQVRNELSRVSNELKEIKEQPGHNLNSLKITTVAAVLSTIIGLVIGKIF